VSSKDEVKNLFTETVDDWARFYEDPKPATLGAQNLVSRRRFAIEMVEARLPRGSKILDVGCGTGHLACELARRGYQTWGTDIAEAMVQYARDHYDPDRFRVGDIEKMDFPDNTFDGIMCLGVVEYLSSDEKALHEMWRVLKPGGYAVITTPSSICPFFYFDRGLVRLRFTLRPLITLVRAIIGKKRPPGRVFPEVKHRRYYKPRWEKLMRSYGLELEDWVVHSWGLYDIERFFPQGAFCRASDRFARNPNVNWLASNQLACVRAVKRPSP
jgi:ubiquinone/menaquinone biosynthesis C-methylase UbiE